MSKGNFKSIEKKEIKKIAVELPFGMGDQIMCFPLFASIKKFIPGAEITALSPNSNSSAILSKNKNIDNVYQYGLKKFTYFEILKFFLFRFLPLRKFFKINSFDLFIVIHPNIFRSLLLKLLPYKSSIINKLNTHKTIESENILRQLDIVPVYDYAMEINDDNDILKKYGLKKEKYILIDLYAQHLDRDPRSWFYFRDLIKLLKNEGETIALAGINPSHSPMPDTVDLVNRTSLDELLVIIKNARITFTLDTAFFHFSYSLKTPVIGIYGPVDPQQRIPLGGGLKVKTLYLKKECSPCIINRVDIECKNKFKPYECLKEITVDMVIKEMKKLL